MKLRLSLTALALIAIGCGRPQITPPVRRAIDLGLPETAALRLTPQQGSRPADLLLFTPPKMSEEAVLRFMEKSCLLGYRYLWVRPVFPPDVEAAEVLLLSASAQLEGGGEKGVILFGSWPGASVLLADTTFKALLWVASAQETMALLAAEDSAASHPRLALIVPDPAPVTLTPVLKGWLRTPEDLVWLATGLPTTALLESDFEPIIRRKAQLFFDRHLKGKR